VLEDALRALGARVSSPIAYVTAPDADGACALRDALLQESIDVVIFSSPSTVQSLHAVLPAMPDACVAVIGPVTAAAARAVGYPVDIIPSEHTAAGVVAALAKHFA
jgi:uroporphyrinogen III methyltransferase/synthase